MMPVTHVNRKRQTYFLHEGKTKTGKPKYFFSKDSEGNVLDAIPDGYEIYENPNAQVFLRKKMPQVITDEEIGAVQIGASEVCPVPELHRERERGTHRRPRSRGRLLPSDVAIHADGRNDSAVLRRPLVLSGQH